MVDKTAQAANYYDYLICIECESPCYIFEFRSEQLVEAFCEACGNDDPDLFLPEEDFEGLAASGSV
jgi:translation initiation factor 2 beta subunit (eIF-2beta)/eIF-5